MLPISTGTTETSFQITLSGTIQNLQTEYSYLVNIVGSDYQIRNGTTGQVIRSGPNATQVINQAIANLNQGDSILFEPGIYTLNGSITCFNKNGMTLNFAGGSLLFVSNGTNNPAIVLVGCSNSVISNPTIDGNAPNQVAALDGTYGSHGIEITSNVPGKNALNYSNVLVTGANITNVRQFGVYILAWEEGDYHSTNCGIRNSVFTFCGWNGITLADGGISNYAINNTVAYSSDVGITNYGQSNIVENNYIYDMNGTTGGGGNSQWGIGVEGGSNHMIINNFISTCKYGIRSTVGTSNLITQNSIYNCSQGGIELDTDFNRVINNTVTQWDYLNKWMPAIWIYGNNNQVSDNILNSTYPHGTGLYLYGNSSQIIGNIITTSNIQGGNNEGIAVYSGSYGSNIEHNTISGGTGSAGVYVHSGAYDTVIVNNNLTSCTNTQKILDLGSGTSIYSNFGVNP
jgi:hypothetical protein